MAFFRRFASSYVLLMFQIPVERDESVEFVSGQCQEFAITLAAPSHMYYCRNIMPNEQAS